jgi:mercuric ion transport protein
MNDRALIGAGMAGAILAAICCATPLLVVVLPLVGLGAWLVRTDLVLLSLLVASFGLIAWVFHRRRTKVSCESGTHKEGMKQ